MTREDKGKIIDELTEKFSNTNFFYITDASGFSVAEVNAFRKACYDKGVEYKVVKNTLIRKALERLDADFSPFYDDVLKGFSGILFTNEANNLPARVIKDFRKKGGYDKPLLKGASIDTELYIGEGNLDMLSSLKSKEELIGVMNPAGKPIHISTPEERSKVPLLADFYVDLGLEPDEVKAKVRIGDMVTLRQEFLDLGKVVTGKALDDRTGCWIAIQTLKRLKDPAFEVHAVFTTQEEVGLRGALTSAYRVEPDIGIALDTTLAVDTPDIKDHQRVTKLGGGVGIKVMDSSAISTRWLLDEFLELAEKRGIDHQLEVLPLGGTDAGAIQRSRLGVPSITLSTPSRYVHTVTEMISKADLEAGVALLTAFLQEGTARLES